MRLFAVVAIVVLVSLPFPLHAQNDEQSGPAVAFSGYIMELPAFEHLQPGLANIAGISSAIWSNLVRLRLRPSVQLGETSKLGLEYEVDGMYQSESSLYDMNSTAPLRQVVNMRWSIASDKYFSADHFIDRLYFSQDLSFGRIVLGRQRISWGTGRVWNPTDIFNPINPANFGKIEKDGSDAASATIDLGQLTNLQIVYNGEYHFKSSNYAARFRTNAGGFDISAMSGFADKRVLIGGDFAGDIGGAGVRGEMLISGNPKNHSLDYTRWILGADYQFTEKLYALVEYYFNGEGSEEKSHYDIASFLEGRILNLARDYVCVTSTYQVHPLVSVSLSSNSNLTDGSGYLSVAVSYSVSDNASASLGSLLTYGTASSEYWYYPQAYYLKVETYF